MLVLASPRMIENYDQPWNIMYCNEACWIQICLEWRRIALSQASQSRDWPPLSRFWGLEEPSARSQVGWLLPDLVLCTDDARTHCHPVFLLARPHPPWPFHDWSTDLPSQFVWDLSWFSWSWTACSLTVTAWYSRGRRFCLCPAMTVLRCSSGSRITTSLRFWLMLRPVSLLLMEQTFWVSQLMERLPVPQRQESLSGCEPDASSSSSSSSGFLGVLLSSVFSSMSSRPILTPLTCSASTRRSSLTGIICCPLGSNQIQQNISSPTRILLLFLRSRVAEIQLQRDIFICFEIARLHLGLDYCPLSSQPQLYLFLGSTWWSIYSRSPSLGHWASCSFVQVSQLSVVEFLGMSGVSTPAQTYLWPIPLKFHRRCIELGADFVTIDLFHVGIIYNALKMGVTVPGSLSGPGHLLRHHTSACCLVSFDVAHCTDFGELLRSLSPISFYNITNAKSNLRLCSEVLSLLTWCQMMSAHIIVPRIEQNMKITAVWMWYLLVSPLNSNACPLDRGQRLPSHVPLHVFHAARVLLVQIHNLKQLQAFPTFGSLLASDSPCKNILPWAQTFIVWVIVVSVSNASLLALEVASTDNMIYLAWLKWTILGLRL